MRTFSIVLCFLECVAHVPASELLDGSMLQNLLNAQKVQPGSVAGHDVRLTRQVGRSSPGRALTMALLACRNPAVGWQMTGRAHMRPLVSSTIKQPLRSRKDIFMEVNAHFMSSHFWDAASNSWSPIPKRPLDETKPLPESEFSAGAADSHKQLRSHFWDALSNSWQPLPDVSVESESDITRDIDGIFMSTRFWDAASQSWKSLPPNPIASGSGVPDPVGEDDEEIGPLEAAIRDCQGQGPRGSPQMKEVSVESQASSVGAGELHDFMSSHYWDAGSSSWQRL